MLRRKSLVESTWHAVGTGQGAMLTTSASPGANCLLSLPSNDAHAWPLLLKGTCTRSVTCSGNIRGLKDKECGQIGVNRMPGTCKLMKLLGYDDSPEEFILIINQSYDIKNSKKYQPWCINEIGEVKSYYKSTMCTVCHHKKWKFECSITFNSKMNSPGYFLRILV